MSFANTILLAELTSWLTPIWLIGAGATLGLLGLLAVWGLTWPIRPRFAARVPAIIKESVLLPVFYLLLFLAGFTLLTAFQMPYGRFIESFQRIGAVGEVVGSDVEFEVPPRSDDYQVDVSFFPSELQSYTIESSQDLRLATKNDDGEMDLVDITIQASEVEYWRLGDRKDAPFTGEVTSLYLINDSDVPARVTLEFITGVEYPQVYVVPATAISVLALFGIYFLIAIAAPKVSVVAVATARQAVAQPIFYLALALGAFLLVTFIYIPGNTFGEDVKMLKDSGLMLILVLAIMVALWTASVSVAEEIEGRTALTLLSKPIGRREFILGKFVGIIWPILLMFVLLGFLLLVTVSYKVVYDARETANPAPAWQQCYSEMIHVVPGLALAFMETVVLAAISVAISTRLPMLPNLMICGAIYVLGHLVPMIVESSVARFEIVRFVGLLIATVFPVLDHFNIQAAVAAGAIVPVAYLLWALLYCVLYSSIAMLLALFLFEDRDLA